ncbi:uncharacterized protein LOC129000466 [Macrosteles quadrilineatus]|uniref:uncharacterized protein LOC129000466 n=1 Tax=Macrosteles quadrilineatus TaxID=74068 RepID=UPI0023E0ABE0|nr:uncharacterized protein LOC129000466 [Macrosteles quadrilineatus]
MNIQPVLYLLSFLLDSLYPSRSQAGIIKWLKSSSSGLKKNEVYGPPNEENSSEGGSPSNFVVGPANTNGSVRQTSSGQVYNVLIEQQRGKTRECEEEIIISLKDKKHKSLSGKCTKSGSPKIIKNVGDFLLVEGPEENFCAFSTNNNEVIYLLDGKWKKGEYGNDNANDKELTSTEVDELKRRIKKWLSFFEESDKEIERLRSLKNAIRVKFFNERNRLTQLLHHERGTCIQSRNEINQQKNHEWQRHSSVMRSIYSQRGLGKLTSDAADRLITEEDTKYNKNIDDLDKMQAREEERLVEANNSYDKQMEEEESKTAEEIRKLNFLEGKEVERVFKQIKINISQGW